MKSKIVDEYLHLNISKKEDNYSIPLTDLSRTIDANFPSYTSKVPRFKNISKIIHHLLTTRNINEKLVTELIKETKRLYPESKIDWDNTNNFIKYFREYRLLFSKKYSEKFPEKKKFTDLFADYDKRQEIHKEVIKELNKK